MHTSRLLASALALTFAEAACPKNIHIIGVPPHDDHGDLGLLASTVQAILDAFPGSNNETLNYPNQDPKEGEAVAFGSKVARKRIQAYSAQCPKTKIVLAGYSEGAIVMLNALCGSNTPALKTPLSSSYAPHIIAAIGYGDESFVANQTWDAGTCTNNSPTNTRKNPAGCNAFASSIKNYCDAPDPACCSGGFYLPAHYAYPSEYNGDVVSFVQARYNATK